MWPSGLSASLQTERLLVRFPVRARAWVAGHVSSYRHVRGNWWVYLSHINVPLPLFLPSLLSKNKQIKSFKKSSWRLKNTI